MSTLAAVTLWGTTIGAVALEDDAVTAAFQYDRAFLRSDIQVAPLMMPLSERIHLFPALSPGSFHGLPGLLADSLPDRFGNALIDAWLARQGRTPQSFNAVERLCYTGTRGMGALEFLPATGPKPGPSTRLDVERLVALASDILSRRGELHGDLTPEAGADALQVILRVGTSAGGARAKALIAWHPETNEVRSGQVDVGGGFQHWLLKFDGVTSNRDRELVDPLGYGAIEYAYYRMATDCGITMSPCRLLAEGPRRHFMTRRFDRTPDGGKLHMQSLAALAHLDFSEAGANSYEQAFEVTRRLGIPTEAGEELYRRMVFNVVARNQDDHVKNIAFLMDRRGAWSLAPAYDMTWAYQPDGRWTSSHQMTVNGKRGDFTQRDLEAAGRAASLKRGRARRILGEVRETVGAWRRYAEEAGVAPDRARMIQDTLRLDL
ncbi:MAG: type II toxin-antitoxin system HipA family toxin [Pseudomonadota bacterium]